MKKKTRQPIRESAILAEVRTPKYRQRIVESEKQYSRKGRKAFRAGQEGIAKAA